MLSSNPTSEDVGKISIILTNQILNGGGKAAEELGESGSIFKHPLGWTVCLVCSYGIVFLVGLVGNGMLVSVLLFRSKMYTVTHGFILNLAVADLLVIIFCAAPTLLTNILIPWVLGSFMCSTVIYVQGISVFASVYSLAAISLDRFVAVWFPTKMPRGLSKFQARCIIFGIWIVAAIIKFPWAIVFTLVEKDGYFYCVESWSSPVASKLYFILGNLVFSYVLPLGLVMLENALIWLRVANRKVPEMASDETITRLHKQTKDTVSRICIVVTLALFISWLPLYVIFIVSKLSDSLPEIMQNLIPFAQILGINNSTLNPILYGFLNKKFRDSFASLMTCPKLFDNNEMVDLKENSPIPQTVVCGQCGNTFKCPMDTI